MLKYRKVDQLKKKRKKKKKSARRKVKVLRGRSAGADMREERLSEKPTSVSQVCLDLS